jgi:hypothetical protein
MADASNYLENELIDHITGKGSYNAPTEWWVQIHTDNPGEDGTANQSTGWTADIKEITSWGTTSGGSNSTAAAVLFETAPGTATIQWISVWDADTAGNCLFIAELDTPRPVSAGDDLNFPIGDITVTLA